MNGEKVIGWYFAFERSIIENFWLSEDYKLQMVMLTYVWADGANHFIYIVTDYYLNRTQKVFFLLGATIQLIGCVDESFATNEMK